MDISNKKRKYIKRCYETKTPQQLASETGLSISEVNKILSEYGIYASQDTADTQNIESGKPATGLFELIVIAMVIVPLFFINGLYDMYSLPKYALLIIFYPLAGALWALKTFSENKIQVYPILKFPLFPLAGFTVLAVLSSLWATNPYESFYHIQKWACVFVVFFVYSNSFKDISKIEILTAIITFTASAVAIIGIFQFFGYNPDFLYQAAVPGTTFGNKNFATQYIVSAWPFSIYATYSFRKNRIGLLSAFSSFVILFFILITRTRSAWLSTLSNFVTATLLFALYAGKHNISVLNLLKTKFNKLCKFILPGLAFMAVFTFLAVNRQDTPKTISLDIEDEFKSITETGKGSANWRLIAWTNTLEMIKDNFIKGIGLGNWEFNYPLYARKARIDPDFNEKRQAKRTHNDFLQITAELGIGGIILFLLFIGNIMYISVRLFFNDSDRRWKLLGITALLSVIEVLCDALFNFPFQESLPPFMLAITGAMITYGYFRNRSRITLFQPSKPISAIVLLIFILLFGFNTVWAYRLCRADYFFLEGKRFSKSEEFEKSIIPFKKSIRLNPYNFRTYSLLGRTYNELKMYYDSVPVNKKALELHPNYMNCMNNLANALRGIHHPDEAIEVYNRALKLYPEFAEAYNNLGIAYKEKGDIETAKKMYLKAVQIDPKYEKALNNLGNIFLAQDNVSEAIKYYDKTIELNPNLSDVYNNYGLALIKKGEYQKSIELFDKCINLTNRLPDPFNNKGTALKAMGRFDDAIIQFEKALVVNNQYLPAINNLAETYLAQNKPDLAAEQYEKLLQTDPSLQSIYQVLVELYLKLYNEKKSVQYIDKALHVIEKGLSYYPKNINFHTLLGKIYLDSDQKEKAIDTFKKVIELEPNKPESYYNLGIAYHLNKNFESAIDNYKLALSLNPEFLFLHLELGKIYEATGKYKDAAASYKFFIDKWKGDPKYTDIAKEKLQQILNSGATAN